MDVFGTAGGVFGLVVIPAGASGHDVDHAQRREQVIEVWISPQDNVLIARSPDLGFQRKLELPPNFKIASIQPAAEVPENTPRRFLMYPGGTIPRIGVELASQSGRKRIVTVDPLSGLLRSEVAK